jgi:predicted nucleotidyltransferase
VDPSQLQDIARRHGILLLLQFGSTVAGRPRPDSDLDLAVLLEHAPETLDQLAALDADLQAIAPGRPVDVAVINRADPLFLKKMLERCTLLYGPARRLHELRMYAFKRHHDHQRYLAMERDYVARAVRSAAR